MFKEVIRPDKTYAIFSKKDILIKAIRDFAISRQFHENISVE